MPLVRVLILIALLTITISNSFPNAYLSSFNEDPLTIALKSNVVRRDDFDPYGFNSILSRFSRHSNLYGIENNNKYFSDEFNFV
ncbi:unnamed protein product [Rotaria sp. Silwood2]|nr:unnamed protein product [Rotaria sp. Silwood2]CAF2770362.1 unnamed protein product [Rotaria sp. Silwood2]CAF2946371.1 unnamed protein product [Rotaria sp. Silwood2]CAF3911126.1 unnamed protein product [Rotaria sp. Silwood2]CAF3975837.1 unnamed protein product [Rotaria sp. Silwood2]